MSRAHIDFELEDDQIVVAAVVVVVVVLDPRLGFRGRIVCVGGGGGGRFVGILFVTVRAVCLTLHGLFI